MGPHRPLVELARGDRYICVAKPPWVVVHRTADMPHASAALQRVRDMVGRQVFPVHRLDRPASGCLLFATEQDYVAPLSAAYNAGRKTYVAFVRGNPRVEGEVVVDKPMKDDHGILKEAHSVVDRLGGCDDPRCGLLRVRPTTGRYHQVRRHVRDLNHPIIGDGEHGDGKINRWWREEGEFDRVGLHCLRMQFTLPEGEPLDIVCPIFEDMGRVLRRLPFWDEAVALEPALGLPTLAMRIKRPQFANSMPGRRPGVPTHRDTSNVSGQGAERHGVDTPEVADLVSSEALGGDGEPG